MNKRVLREQLTDNDPVGNTNRHQIAIISLYHEHKFNKRLIKFIDTKFTEWRIFHILLGRPSSDDCPYEKSKNIYINAGGNRLTRLLSVLPQLRKADTVVLNGLFYPVWFLSLIIFFSFNKKRVWIGWGGDIYKKKESLLWELAYQYIIERHLDIIALPVPQDLEKIKERFKRYNGKVAGFWFPTQLNLNDGSYVARATGRRRIMIGHSADPSNNHCRIIDSLAKSRCRCNEVEYVFVLAYGNRDYGARVLEYARFKLGDGSVVGVEDAVSPDNYFNFLKTIDVGIFDQERQQAGQNILMLSSLGAKIFLNKRNTFFDFLRSNGISVYDVSSVHGGHCPLADDYPFPSSSSRAQAQYILSDEYAFRRIGDFLRQITKVDNVQFHNVGIDGQ